MPALKKLWPLGLVLLLFVPLLLSASNVEGSGTSERRLLEEFIEDFFTGQDVERLNPKEFKVLGHLANSYSRIASGTYGYEDLWRLYKNSGAFIEPNAQHLATFMGLMDGILPSADRFDTSYARTLFYVVNTHRNANQLTQADSLNGLLIDYCEGFDKGDVPNQALVYAQIHQNVISLIRGDHEKAYNDAMVASALAEETGDTALIITANYYLADCYVKLGDIERFLKTVERNYKMDSAAVVKSDYRDASIGQWLDALVYLNKQPARISQLLEEISVGKNGLVVSLEYRLNWLAKLSSDDSYYKNQLSLFKTSNLIELVDTLDKLVSARLDRNHQIHFLTNSAKVFYMHEHYPEAMQQYGKALKTTKEVYSEKLSKELAEIEANKVTREKDEEIRTEQAKKQRYIIIAVSAGLLVIVVLVALMSQLRLTNKLKAQNDEIEHQRQKLEKTDNEKALLLKEIHHRVKNNFQIVSSLLELQTKGIEDDKARELAEEGKNRVKSMALIHQRLYQNDDMLISFDEYIKALVDEISEMYKPEENVHISIDAKDMSFDIDTAIPLGLIINELVTNSFKYGLDAKDAALDIKVEKGEQDYRLTVKDNGIGLPKNLDLSKAKSLGLRLVKRLSQQLKGRATTIESDGAAIAVYFKDTAARSILS